MNTNILTIARALSDRDLLARIDALARTEREATAELVGHLAALELRPSLYAAQGYGSLFDYCTHVLRLSEDAACTRTRVARVCLRFPLILDLLSSGAVSLSAVRLLGPHLTAENHEEILARATSKRLQDIQALVAELAPRPDVPASMRKLPSPIAPASLPSDRTPMLIDAPAAGGTDPAGATDGNGGADATIDGGTAGPVIGDRHDLTTVPSSAADAALGAADPADAYQRTVSSPPWPTVRRTARPVLQPLSPQRYRVQFTIGQETHDAVKRLQSLMRRELPDGDLATIFDQGVCLLLEKVEKAKFGVGVKRRPETAKTSEDAHTYETRIRFKTDSGGGEPRREDAGSRTDVFEETANDPPESPLAGPRSEARAAIRRREGPSRHIPSAVKRAVWRRDGGQCAFVSAGGRRCTEGAFLELHHIHPHALDGPATVANISLRCRRHNAYEAELFFGPRAAPAIGDAG